MSESDKYLFHGDWNTSAGTKRTTITATSLVEPKVFLISCTELVDAQIGKFRFSVDGKDIITQLHEGSGVVIEGKSIYIEQIGTGAFGGAWTVLQEEHTPCSSPNWAVNTKLGNQTLIAAFNSPQDFVLMLHVSSKKGEDTLVTKDGSMLIAIDGKIVEDDQGEALRFLEGSSVIGRGSIISVVVTGANDRYTGTLKIRT